MCALARGLPIDHSPVRHGRRLASADNRSAGSLMHHPIATATAAFLISLAQSASAQDLTSQIVGTWKWTGTTQKRQIEIVGNKLSLMSAPFRSAHSGQETVLS